MLLCWLSVLLTTLLLVPGCFTPARLILHSKHALTLLIQLLLTPSCFTPTCFFLHSKPVLLLLLLITLCLPMPSCRMHSMHVCPVLPPLVWLLHALLMHHFNLCWFLPLAMAVLVHGWNTSCGCRQVVKGVLILPCLDRALITCCLRHVLSMFWLAAFLRAAAVLLALPAVCADRLAVHVLSTAVLLL